MNWIFFSFWYICEKKKHSIQFVLSFCWKMKTFRIRISFGFLLCNVSYKIRRPKKKSSIRKEIKSKPTQAIGFLFWLFWMSNSETNQTIKQETRKINSSYTWSNDIPKWLHNHCGIKTRWFGANFFFFWNGITLTDTVRMFSQIYLTEHVQWEKKRKRSKQRRKIFSR